jgi:flagellar biogenesis protein FliO
MVFKMFRWILPSIIACAAFGGSAAAQAQPGGYDHVFDPAAPAVRTDAGPAARPVGPAAGGVQRATYQDGADFRGSAPALKRPEPMPIGGSMHDAADKSGHDVADRTGNRTGRHDVPAAPSAIPAMTSMILSLVVVLGLFFGLAWLMKRGLPKGARLLSNDVVQVLGRAPLGGRQQMHVVRFGNKLLLLSLSPGGAETLSEIVDPVEVDRLAGLCQQADVHSATTAFRNIFRQFGDERRSSGHRPDLRAPSGTEADDV